MSHGIELWVNPDNISQTQIKEFELSPLAEGEIRVAIERFALTANNVTYAVTGNTIGYWGYYPTGEAGWGKVPCWGIADVVESNNSEVPVGERLYGFFPMASHATLMAGKVNEDSIIDTAVHRQQLPALYNGYRRTKSEPEILSQMESQRCLLFPLFATSFVLFDYLLDNDYFGAGQILIGSVSSKTGLGLAQMLKSNPDLPAKVVGLTSQRNLDFVNKLDCCHDVVVYGDEHKIDASIPTAYVDMSGNRQLTTTLHEHLKDNMKESCKVGLSHWQDAGQDKDLPGAKPRFFFAPSQIEKRDKEWGRGVVMAKATEASIAVAQKIAGDLHIENIIGMTDFENMWQEIVANKVAPNRGLIVSLKQG